MYGLVNRAIHDMIATRFGDSAWEAVKARAGVDIELFVSMQSYEDGVTYRLVEAASEVLSITPAAALIAFGEYWTLYTAQHGYADLLKLGGSSFREFMLNLHNLHSHVGMAFPHLTPPSFWCTDVGSDRLVLHYQSTRPGLAPMVIGLVQGLGKMFATEVSIQQTRDRGAGAEHDEFEVEFRAL